MTNKKKNNNYESVIVKASKALADDYTRMDNHPNGAVDPVVNYSLIMEEILTDDEIRGYLSKKTNTLIRAGHLWQGDESEVKTAISRAKEIHLNRHLKKMYFKGMSSGMIFIELIPNATKTKIIDLRIHDESKMKVNLRKNGDVSSFTKKEPTGGTVNFKNDKEMVVIKIDHIIDSFWTHPKIATLYQLIRLKQLVVEHVDALFETNQFKKHFHARNLAAKDIKSFITMIKQGMVDRKKFLITVGVEDMKAQSISDPVELQEYIKLLDHISLKIMNILDVPPIVAGVTEGSNRSNSTSQTDVTFADAIISFQRDFEDEFNAQLIPLLGIKALLIHKPINTKNVKEIADIAVLMMSNGADKKMMLSWMQQEGLDFPNGLFDESIKREKESLQMQKDSLPQNSDQFPSRQSQEKDIKKFGDDKNINGTAKK